MRVAPTVFLLMSAALSWGCAPTLSDPDSPVRIDETLLRSHRLLADQLIDEFESAERLRVDEGPIVDEFRESPDPELRSLDVRLSGTLALAIELEERSLPGDPYAIAEDLRETREYLAAAHGFLLRAQGQWLGSSDAGTTGPFLDLTKEAIRQAGVHHDSLTGFVTNPAFDFELFPGNWPQRDLTTDHQAAISSLHRMLDLNPDTDWPVKWRAEAVWCEDLVRRSAAALGAIDRAQESFEAFDPPTMARRYTSVEQRLSELGRELSVAPPDLNSARREAEAALAEMVGENGPSAVGAQW